MLNWRQEYLNSLYESEMNNPDRRAYEVGIKQTGSQMADRISVLEAQRTTLEAQLSSPQTPVSASSGKSAADDGRQAHPASAAQLRHDLAEALRSRGATETRLRAAEEELARLRSKTKEDARSVRHLTAERTTLTTRLNDREYELREKRKLLEQVQDEMIALNLQVSVAEKERDKVKKENKELVDRWMKRVAHEADAMNLANEPKAR